MDEQLIISGGPRAVATAVAEGANPVELRFLGQSCARLARDAEVYQDALQWSDAAVLCYREAARSLKDWYVRHDVELVQYGIMLAMIYKYGSSSPELQKYLDDIIEWLDALRREFADEGAFRAASEQSQKPAILLQESLALTQDIWHMGLLAPDYDRWFFVAGFSRGSELTSSDGASSAPPPARQAVLDKARWISIYQKSLRPRIPPSAPPIAAVVVGEVAIAIVASNWGDWAGLAAEQPAVSAALSVLEAAARDRSYDWPKVLTHAFAAVPPAIDPFVQPDPQFHDFYDPITSLTCAVLTPDDTFIAWTGSTAACLMTNGQIDRTTNPLTVYEKYRRAGLSQEDLERIPVHLRNKIEDKVGPSTHENPSPELIVWPRLRPDQSLLLTNLHMMRLLHHRLPLSSDLTGGAWLHAALSIDIDNVNEDGLPEFGDRIGVLFVPA